MTTHGQVRNRFDRLAKQIAQEALRACGVTVVQAEIVAETQYADLSHVPDPARVAERQRLGLLGRLTAAPCLIEVYSHAPSAEELRACLTKHLVSWQHRAREHRKRSEPAMQQQAAPAERFVDSSLWIIAAGAPRSVLAELGWKAAPTPEWPPGIYSFGGQMLRAGIVVASELPREDSTTLLVRLMAAGPLLPQAVQEVAMLEPDAYERVVAEPALLSFQRLIGQDRSQPLDEDEQEFIMAMIKSWEEGRAEARAETKVQAVLSVLRARGVEVPEAARARILAQTDLELLERWLVRASVTSSVGEVIDDPS
jgi:hypothetical protein